jgi:hypothetical protein
MPNSAFQLSRYRGPLNSALDRMKTSQCVMPRRPPVCPNIGRSGVSASTSRSGTWVSFHLKTSTPSGSRTRKHSANPRRRSSRQSSPSQSCSRASCPSPQAFHYAGRRTPHRGFLGQTTSCVLRSMGLALASLIPFPQFLACGLIPCYTRLNSITQTQGFASHDLCPLMEFHRRI